MRIRQARSRGYQDSQRGAFARSGRADDELIGDAANVRGWIERLAPAAPANQWYRRIPLEEGGVDKRRAGPMLDRQDQLGEIAGSYHRPAHTLLHPSPGQLLMIASGALASSRRATIPIALRSLMMSRQRSSAISGFGSKTTVVMVHQPNGIPAAAAAIAASISAI